jgi:sec-independent protein translocase protein TatB
MFDVGFFELLLIGIVGLLVIGPERLPKVARTAGMWFGRARRFVGSVKQDIEQEMRTEELKKALDENKIGNPLKEAVEDTKKSFTEIREETESAVQAAEDSLKSNSEQDKTQAGGNSP